MSDGYGNAEAWQPVFLRGGEEEAILSLRTKYDDSGALKEEEKEEEEKLSRTFEFILVDDSNPEAKKKNRSIAHSHVKKTDRRTKRDRQTQRKEPLRKLIGGVALEGIDEDDLEELCSGHAKAMRASSVDSLTWRKSSFSDEDLFQSLDDNNCSISTFRSMSLTVDAGVSTAFAGSFGAQDPCTRLMLDHSLKVLWPGLMPGVADGAYHPLSVAWFQAMCQSRALSHTVVVAGARHLDFLRKSTSFSDSQLVLAHKGKAIRELRHALADPAQAFSDENILTMLWMASAEIVPEDHYQAPKSAFNPPLPNDQWIDAWASASGTEHSNMMRELIEMRGGLENIGLFGLAKVLSLATTILVTSRLIQPYHPFLEGVPTLQPKSRRFVDQKRISRTILNNVIPTYVQSLPDLSNHEPMCWSGFRGLVPLGLNEQALGVFQDMRCYSALLEKYCSGESWTYTRMEIVDMRNAVQHRLVSLPLGSDLGDLTMQQAGICECCRLTALLYACAVTFPLPPSTGWDRNLVRGVQRTLENLALESWPIYQWELHLWALTLAGIAAVQKAERAWFVDQLQILARRKGLSDWSQVLPVLKSFLWMDMACGTGGISLWDEVRGWTPASSPSGIAVSPWIDCTPYHL